MAIDERKDYTSADTLTVDDALSLAVMGYRVRAKDMQPGAYIDYQFAGWRINFPGGSSSGWSRRSHDETVEWHVVDEPEPAKPEPSKWGKGIALDIQQQGRALREPPVGDVLIIDHAGKWGLPPKPVEPKPATADSVGKWGKAVAPAKDKWGR